MTLKFDPEADAAYLPIGRDLSPGESVFQVSEIRGPLGGGEITLDFDSEGRLIGIEVLGASKLLRPEDLAP